MAEWMWLDSTNFQNMWLHVPHKVEEKMNEILKIGREEYESG